MERNLWRKRMTGRKKKLACGLEKRMENGKKEGNERDTGRQNNKKERDWKKEETCRERERMNLRERGKSWRNRGKKGQGK